ncbi:uncharacterized protein LOC142162667 [Nicotiana tabacum]|uniref:Uncharacterized protein LOC142162667 n=1 Tax=Nicotiana tabacum TaxID=4097 RepID=A0AC58RRD8_TOBAC
MGETERLLLLQLDSPPLQSIYREKNCVADSLANYGAMHANECCLLFGSPPPFITPSYQQDQNGMLRRRLIRTMSALCDSSSLTSTVPSNHSSVLSSSFVNSNGSHTRALVKNSTFVNSMPLVHLLNSSLLLSFTFSYSCVINTTMGDDKAVENQITGKSIFSPSPSPTITIVKLDGSGNYTSWAASVQLWFIGQGYEDHLIKNYTEIGASDRPTWVKIDAQLCSLLWNSLDRFGTRPKPCIQMTYNLFTRRDREKDFFMVLALIELRSDLSSVRDQILASASVPTLEEVSARLLRITSTLEVNSYDTSIMAVQTNTFQNGPRKGKGKNTKHCTYCDKGRHTRDVCWLLHGKPPRNNDHHRHATNVAHSGDGILPTPDVKDRSSHSITLTGTDYNDYLQYQASKQQSSTSSTACTVQPGNSFAYVAQSSFPGPWILDSGATDHISGNQNFLSVLNSLSVFSTITLANGSKTAIKGIGEAHPLPSLPLTSVLFAPECPYNLISISKLTKNLKCLVIFSEDSVFVQDRSSGQVIGRGHESHGLYNLSITKPPVAFTSAISSDLLHCQLGHPSLSKLQKMVPSLSSLPLLECESCQLGKHTRASFPKRVNNRSSSMFENFYTEIRNQFGVSIKKLISDNAREYFSSSLSSFMSSQDVTFFETSPYFSPNSLNQKAISTVLLVPTFSPPTPAPALPLQVYSRRPRPNSQPTNPVDASDPNAGTQSPSGDSLPPPAMSHASVEHSSNVTDLPIALRKGTRTTANQTPSYTFLSYHRLSPSYHAFITSLSTVKVPKTMEEAMAHPGWRQAMIEEMTALHDNGTWEIVPLPKGKTTVGCRWVFTVAQSGSGIVISQRKYALDILEDSGMLNCKPVDSPMDPNTKLVPGQGKPLKDPGRYRRLVGKLNYLTITRPDISFAVSVVSQFLQSPCDSHWDAAIRILRYVKGSPGQGLLYENKGHADIVGYSDADWAGSPSDRRSTSGYCILIGGNLISWKSKKQDVVARSSVEAEYRAMALATCELIWLRQLLQELKIGRDEPMKLICDNQAALYIASNPVFHERSKHIEVDCHFIRQKIESGCIVTSFVNSKDQLADVLTKSLRGSRIGDICSKLGAYDLYAPA